VQKHLFTLQLDSIYASLQDTCMHKNTCMAFVNIGNVKIQIAVLS